MVSHVADPVQNDERDDMQHIQTQRLLALRVIAPPKSRLGQLINQRLAELYERLGEDVDPAKRRELFPGIKALGAGPDAIEVSKDVANADQVGGLAASNAEVVGLAANVDRESLAAQLQERARTLNESNAPGAREENPAVVQNDTSLKTAPETALQNGRVRQSQEARLAQNNQVNWVVMLSMLLQTDLKRLGLEPDEFDDIRVFLIKSEAQKFDKLELLSRLPDSLSPEAVTKIFEDIRTMAAGYVAFVLIERAKSDLENGEEIKQMPEVPSSVSNCFYGIPLIDFNPEDVLKKTA